ncbi:hypothetical protein BSKO_10012 [Bryopsis sp. KO-2023]|nr:hypothetical protein BSKO_10012 [Bryopsis sp. KO-2023]
MGRLMDLGKTDSFAKNEFETAGTSAGHPTSFLTKFKERISSFRKGSPVSEADAKSPRHVLRAPLTYTWLKKKMTIRRQSRATGKIPENAYKGESLAGYCVEPKAKSETAQGAEERKKALEAEISFHSLFLCDGDDRDPEPLIEEELPKSRSKPSSPTTKAVDEAISCSKTDFGHFTKVLDEPYASSLKSMWSLPSRSGSRAGNIMSVRPSSRNSTRSYSEDSSEVCSPNSENGGDCNANLEMTLRDIRRLLREAQAGDVIDLVGNDIQGSGSITISIDDVTLQNGRLDLSGGITVKARGVKLLNLEIHSSASQANALKIHSSDCTVTYCTISSREGSGVLVEGMASSASLRSCCIHDCFSNCLWVARGAQVDCSSSEICRSKKFHGVAADSSGTTLRLTGCRIHDNYQDGVLVAGGSDVSVDGCEIWGSTKFHGISVKRQTSYAKVTRSKVFDNAQTCAYVCDGGRLDFFFSEAWGASTYGLMCTGEGSVIHSNKSHIFDSHLDTIRITCGAALESDGGEFQGSRMASSLVVLSGGHCTLRGVDISSSALCGVWVSGEGSNAKILRNHIHDNEICNMFVDGGAWCVLSDSKMYGAKHGASVVAKGKGSRVIVSTSLVKSNPKGNYISFSKARLCVDGLKSKQGRRGALWLRELLAKHPSNEWSPCCGGLKSPKS